jgi:hypothetical protein
MKDASYPSGQKMRQPVWVGALSGVLLGMFALNALSFPVATFAVWLRGFETNGVSLEAVTSSDDRLDASSATGDETRKKSASQVAWGFIFSGLERGPKLPGHVLSWLSFNEAIF